MALLWRDRELLLAAPGIPSSLPVSQNGHHHVARCQVLVFVASSVIPRHPRFHLLHVCSPLRHRGYDIRAAWREKTGIAASCYYCPSGEMMSSKSKTPRQYRVFVFSFLARNEFGSPFTMYVLQVLQSQSPDIGLFDIDLSGPSLVAYPPSLSSPRAVGVARRRCRSRAHYHRATLK